MLEKWQAFESLAEAFGAGEVCLRVTGLPGSARALVVSELLQRQGRSALVIVSSLADAHRWTQDLRFFGLSVFEFPEREPRLWRGGQHREADAERAVIVRRLQTGEAVGVVATPAALDTPLPSPTHFVAGTLRVSVGDRPAPGPPLA